MFTFIHYNFTYMYLYIYTIIRYLTFRHKLVYYMNKLIIHIQNYSIDICRYIYYHFNCTQYIYYALNLFAYR